MSQHTRRWRGMTPEPRERTRWLGLIQPPLRFRLQQARRADLSPSTLGVPLHLAVPNFEPEEVGRLAAAARLSAPRAVGSAVPRLGPGGSIDLEERWVKDGVRPPFGAHTAGSPPKEVEEEQAAEPRRAGGQAGGPRVPLWKRLAYLLQVPAELLLTGEGPTEWPGALFPYQLDGIRALLSRDALLLADDMGLGKTVQAAAALRILVLRRQVEHSLFVVPASLVTQWREALRRWAPELRVSTVHGPTKERAWQWMAPAHVYLTSYETFREDATDNPQSPPRRRRWDVVVLDEAQRIKNREADVSRKCKLLVRRRAWALSGTPLENSLNDLASVLEFVAPRRAGEIPERLVPGVALRERQQQVQLRRRKRDVLPQLPPKLVSHLTLSLGGAQRDSYRQAEREGVIQLRERGASLRVEHVLELITRLKQICNVCPVSGQSAKLDDLEQRLATLSAEGHRALIFSQFTDEQFGVRAIARRLRHYRPLVYTGDLAVAQRDEAIHQFKDDVERRALVLSLRAGGQGLNLQEASYVFHFDRWWNPAVERQAEDRSHRLGQTVPVHVYTYTCEGTVEERIARTLQKKQRLFDDVVDDVSLDLHTALTREELFGLFNLPPSLDA